jgi:hypothetical protein
MFMTIHVRTHLVVAQTAVVAAAGVAAMTFASPAQAESLPIHEEFVVDCLAPMDSQQCGLGHWNFFAAPETVNVRFTAGGNHCSDINARISLDHSQEKVMRLGPGQSTGVLQFNNPSLPASAANPNPNAGNRGIFITADGIPGGCNTGALSSFGGTVEIW